MMIRIAVGLAALISFAASMPAQNLLDVARWYAFPEEGEFHYLADVDVDGDVDVLWFQGEPGTPTIWEGFGAYLNDGTGELTAAEPFLAFPASTNRFLPLYDYDVRELSDLTGDGLPDVPILEASGIDHVAVHVYPALAGGGWDAPVTIPLSGKMQTAALGDPDGDGVDEIVICDEVNDDQRIAWFDWDGAGFVGTGVVTILGSFGDPAIERFAVTDYDGDGDVDLVAGQRDGDELILLPTVNGAVTLGPSIHVTTNTNFTPNLSPFVVPSDDGFDDLIVVNAPISSEFEFIPVENRGGAFVVGDPQLFVNLQQNSYPSNFFVGDWDGDGDAEVLHYPYELPGGTVEGVVAIWENDDGDFGDGHVAELETVYQTYYGPGLADLDADGHLDFVGAQTVSFGDGTITSTLVEITDTFFGAEPLVAADAEGDGDVDLYYWYGSRLVNDATGAFEPGGGAPAPPPGTDWRAVSAIGDFTGDGLLDMVRGYEEPAQGPFGFPTFLGTRLVADDGLGSFEDLGVATTGSMAPFSRSVNLTADIDADGDVDALDYEISMGGFWPNDGAGTFGAFVPLFVGEPGLVADFDGDGDLDAVSAEFGNGVVRLHENDGALGFTSTTIFDDLGTPESDSFVAHDVDLDGDLELAFTPSPGVGAIHVYENDGLGGFALAAAVSTDQPLPFNDPAYVSLGFDDVDGDGNVDLLAMPEDAFSSTPRETALFLHRGGFVFDPMRRYVGSPGGVFADVDADGDVDVVGRALVRSRRFEGPEDGAVRQFGEAFSGSGGAAPLLGASGPLRPGSTTASLRLRRVVGGTTVYLVRSGFAAEISGFPFAGATFYVGAPFTFSAIPLGGTPGQPGAGALDIGIPTSILASAAGVTAYVQIAAFDPGSSSGISLSRGLELTLGL